MIPNPHRVGKTPHYLTAFVLTLSFMNAAAQRQANVSYVKVDGVVTATKPGVIPQQQRFSWYDDLFWEFANIAREEVAIQRDEQRMQVERDEALTRLKMVKDEFAASNTLPESIEDGWHNAIATDNLNFCRDVKVYVTDNRIRKFVIDNYLPIDFIATREISNGRTLVSLKSFNGEDLSIVELFFLYDLESPALVDPPIEPGYACFWSDMKTFADIQITFNGARVENLTASYDSQPQLFDNGTVSRILKPGMYSYIALGKGAIDWRGTFEVKPGEAAMVRFGR